jgi:hypothetical protein
VDVLAILMMTALLIKIVKEEIFLAVNMILIKMDLNMFKVLKKIYYWFRYISLRLKRRDILYFYQRITRGWDDGDTFSLDHSLAKLIYPRLKRFKELTINEPPLPEEKEWSDQLDKMIAAFEYAGSEYRWNNPLDALKHEEGVELFAKNYFRLWW